MSSLRIRLTRKDVFWSLMVRLNELVDSIHPSDSPILAMKILDPNMPDGTYDWRDGRRVVKEGVRLYIEGTDTLAGRYAFILSSFKST